MRDILEFAPSVAWILLIKITLTNPLLLIYRWANLFNNLKEEAKC